MSRVLTPKEAMEALLAGKKVRNINSSDGFYFFLNSKGVMETDSGRTDLIWDLEEEMYLYEPKIELTKEKLEKLWNEIAAEHYINPAHNSLIYPILVKKLGL